MRYAMLLAILLLHGSNVFGCDACGCSISGQGIGLMTNYRTNSVGVRYYHIPFHAAANLDKSTKDVFHVMEAYVRYELNPKLKVSAAMPYRIHRRMEALDHEQELSGFGDARLIGHYSLVDQRMGKNAKFYWEIGAGIKFPTGKYNENLIDQDLPHNFNIGNGSWGSLFQNNVVISKNQFGLSWNTSAQINWKTSASYRFGHQLSSSLILFMERAVFEKGRIVPFGGLSMERVSSDQHANGNSAHGTGGSGLFSMAGVNIGWDGWQLGAAYLMPFNQKYSDSEVEAKHRFTVEINYFF